MDIASTSMRTMMRRAHQRALELHAQSLTIEHLVEVALKDEDSAAWQAVSFAFADPMTLSQEVLALSDGLMVVGSKAVLPFSPLAVVSLQEARQGAVLRAASGVLLTDVLEKACQNLPVEICAQLNAAGLRLETLVHADEEGEALSREGPLFRHFENDARRALSLACKTTAQENLSAISPAHLILGTLQASSEKNLAGLSLSAAREVLRGHTADPTPPLRRELESNPQLEELLQTLGPDADSLDLLLACHQHGSAELRAALDRHKISPTLLQRARSAWHDQSG
jgi:ATP-dependent Clp protease ATP-binding subunit ClpA